MTAPSAPATTIAAAPWTCPFCPLLCDQFALQVDPATQRLALDGSDCPRARSALARFTAFPPQASAQVNGRDVGVDEALAVAASLLAASRQPLFGGLGTDVAGARALYRLAHETGAICDAASGPALMHGLRALQDRGAFTTTLAEVRERADLVVCLTGSPTDRQPEFYRRCGLFDAPPTGGVGPAASSLKRHLVVMGPAPLDAQEVVPQGLPSHVAAETLPWHGDVFTTVSVLAALVAGRTVRDAPAGLVALAARLHAARYAVIVWEGAALPANGALVVEAVNTLVGTLNRHTRAAAFPLGGGDGAATVNQVFAWLGGLPLRLRVATDGLEHDPLRFDATHLLADGAVDALLWVASFGTEPPPPVAGLPRIVLAHPDTVVPAGQAQTVFIPVASPGMGSPGHLFRTDGVVLMPLHAGRPDNLPTVAEVVVRLLAAVQGLRSWGGGA